MAIKRGIRAKIFLLSATIILIPLMVLSLFVMGRTVTTAEKNHENYQQASMKKVGQAVETIMRELERASLFMIGDKDIRTYLSTGDKELLDDVYNTLIYLRNNSDYIKAIQIEGANGEVLANGSMPLNITRADRERADALNGKSFWGQDEDIYGERYLYLCRLLRDTENPSHHLGTAKLYLDSRGLSDYLRSEMEPSMNYVILDEEGRLLFNTGFPEEKGDILNYNNLLAGTGGCYRTEEQAKEDEYYLSPYGLAAGRWILCGVSGTGDVDSMISASLLLILGLSVSCFLVCAALALLVSQRILKPLSEVIRHMDTFGHQDFSTRIEVRGNDEAALVARHFNQMADQIQDLIQKVYEGTIRKKEAELKALQAQINPHFIYNTLFSVKCLVSLGENDTAERMLENFTAMLRTILGQKDEMISLQEELVILHQYFVVLQCKYGDEILLDVDIPEDLLKQRVLKFVLQPIVENSIFHGLEPAGSKGHVVVRAWERGARLYLSVEDDGAGMDCNRLKEVQGTIGSDNSTMVGINNTVKRIKLHFGAQYGVEISSEKDVGTKVVLILPSIKAEGQAAKGDGAY
mgnify:CR=1 FL=1